MATRDLPDLDLARFRAALAPLSPVSLEEAPVAALLAHYQELRRWNRSLSLIGPGTVDEVLSRHYGESLAALPLVNPSCGEVVDVGSGAGFHGFVLAAMLFTARVTLVEARERKWAFLQAAARRAALPVKCLNARVAASLPAGLPAEIDLVTARALKLPVELLSVLAARLTPEGQMLLWVGEEAPIPPPGWHIERELRLAGAARRRIVELRRTRS